MPGKEHEEDRPEDLLLVEDVAVLLDPDQSAERVVGRGPALALEKVLKVVDEFP